MLKTTTNESIKRHLYNAKFTNESKAQ